VTTPRADRVRALYDAFRDRDLDAVLAAMAPDVDWPNGWEGGRLVGVESVRSYWERQWRELRPSMTVRKVTERSDGTVEVLVRLVVRDPSGTVLTRSDVLHVHEFANDLVKRMTIAEP
jgi:ketosteroid isomerase-like protein